MSDFRKSTLSEVPIDLIINLEGVAIRASCILFKKKTNSGLVCRHFFKKKDNNKIFVTYKKII
jgi:hypothetical protein